MKCHIYADNAATTKLDTVAFEAMTPWLFEEYGNASQPHTPSRESPRKPLQRQEPQLQNVSVHCRRRYISPPVVPRVTTGSSKVRRF